MTLRTTTLAAASLIALAAAAPAETLRLGDWQSTTHIVSEEGTTHWMDAVEEATDGEITFEHFPAEQAAKANALLDAVRNNILDAALIGPSYHSDLMPLNSVVGLPGLYTSAVEGTEAMQEMMAEGPLRDELTELGVVPIFSFVLPPYQVLAKERLGEPADWDGLDLRTSGSTQALTARSLGAVGISLPGPEIYTAVERGRLDGIFFPLASVPAYKLNEVVSHISTNASFGGYSFVVVVGQEVWDGLSEEQQTALIEAGNEAAMNVAQAQDDSIGGLLETWRSEGVDTYEMTDEELSAVNAALEEVAADWVSRVGGDGAAQAVLDQFKSLTAD
ncbi:TRAP transporter substrate-binding protein DctP [Psychromarinibacter sp. C21-152]|uniref:TRAP transporter substrate-binding protein DctP n=1 Tax=Psychromarinibacter sediminicola TaxID=3033385 RepID=A0AAE3T7Q6_9RHOB|nr:TRAP transporter substrate-binding protein DctP [Psychromarinibacter sediminicola]MDF0599274.1 TRAP transporter substrate-binding protein DctP [Psychromarinibacter sediminicola]